MRTWILVNDALLVIGSGLLLLTGCLAARGWNGLLVTWSPTCRRCRFDLRGCSGSTCPECGADLARWGGVSEGLRQHRWGLLGATLLLVIVASGLIASSRFGWPERGWAWWLLNRPLWAMEGLLKDQDTTAWSTAIRREAEGKLSAGELRWLLGLALELPTNNGDYSTPSWNWLCEQVASGRVTLDAIKPAVDRSLQTMEVGLDFAPHGQRAGGRVDLERVHVATTNILNLDPIQVTALEAKIGDAWVPLRLQQTAERSRLGTVIRQGGLSFIAPQELGACAIRATVQLTARAPSTTVFQRGPVLAQCERVLDLGTLRVLDPNATFALGAHDEAFRSRIQPLLVDAVGSIPRSGPGVFSSQSSQLPLQATEAFDFDVEGVQGGRTVPLGRINRIGGSTSSSMRSSGAIDHTRPWTLRFVPRLDRIEQQLEEPTLVFDAPIEIPRGPIDADPDEPREVDAPVESGNAPTP